MNIDIRHPTPDSRHPTFDNDCRLSVISRQVIKSSLVSRHSSLELRMTSDERRSLPSWVVGRRLSAPFPRPERAALNSVGQRPTLERTDIEPCKGDRQSSDVGRRMSVIGRRPLIGCRPYRAQNCCRPFRRALPYANALRPFRAENVHHPKAESLASPSVGQRPTLERTSFQGCRPCIHSKA